MLKQLLTLSFAISLCTATLVPLSEYNGDNKYKCGFGNPMTGARIGDTLYTFGGCYPIPYIVDPNSDDYGYQHDFDYNKYVNMSDTIQTYDITHDVWSQEKNVKTPFPWRKAITQTYQDNIYFHRIRTTGDMDYRMQQSKESWWKYDTVLKTWTDLGRFPFIWLGTLASCQYGDRIYFAGTEDGQQRSIIQVFHAKDEVWEKPIFPNKDTFRIRQMLCNEKYIHILGQKENRMFKPGYESMDEFRVFRETFDMTRIDRRTGETFSRDTNIAGDMYPNNITGNFDRVAVKDDSFYILSVESQNSTIFKYNTSTDIKTTLGTFPFTLNIPWVVPYENDQVLLFGGGDDQSLFQDIVYRERSHVNTIKTYHHKLIPDNNQEKEEIKLVLQNQ